MALLGIFDTNQISRPVKPLKGDNVEAIRKVLVDVGMDVVRTAEDVSASTPDD